MSGLLNRIIQFLQEEDGPTAVEYAMMILLIFLACLTAIIAIGQATAGSFEGSSNSIDSAMTAS